MLLKVKDSEGNVYTMPSNTPKCILEVHYSTSYYQFIIQDHFIDENGNHSLPEKTIIVPIDGGSWVDLIGVNDDEIGEIVD